MGDKRRRRLGIIAGISLVSLCISVAAGYTEPILPPLSFTPLVERLQAVVVHVSTHDASFRQRSPLEQFFQPFSGEPQFAPDTHLASGVIVTPDGSILTSNRALPPGTSLAVTLLNQQTYAAQVVGRDRAVDLALLRIEPTTPLQTASLVESVVQPSPAAQVGLQRHDIIVEVNCAPVTEAMVFQRLLEETKAPLLLLVKRRNGSALPALALRVEA